MPLHYLLFDVDDTLYSPQCGLWAAIRDRINGYLVERIGVDPAKVSGLREHYFATYGTTLNGLIRERQVDVDDFLHYVHDVPLANYLQASPELAQMLARLPQPKIIFTNASTAHAERVLNHLGIAQYFDRIVDICALRLYNKPDPQAYTELLSLIQVPPTECLFADDQSRNLRPARALGMQTVWVNTAPAPATTPPDFDHHIAHILELEKILAPH